MRSLACALAAVFVLYGCGSYETAREPEAYIARGDAVLEVEFMDDETRFEGRFEARYFLGDALTVAGAEFRQVRLVRLQAWMNDRNYIAPHVGRVDEDDIYHLKCTTVNVIGPVSGMTDAAGQLSFEEAAVTGVSYEERDERGGCPGETVVFAFDGATDRALTGLHDPVGNRFELATTFEQEADGEEVDGSIELTGYFVNRPPKAQVASAADGLFNRLDGGCPPTEKGYIDSNHPDGLKARFESRSTDPDGGFSRADIVREQWAHYEREVGIPGETYEFLGRGHAVGPVLFAADREHTVVLAVFDRRGARSEDRCTFRVAPAR